MRLFHYYDAGVGPFRSISRLPHYQAITVLAGIRADKPRTFAAARDLDYLARRLAFEATLRERFVAKGGRPVLDHPHYLIVEPSPWLAGWFDDSAAVVVDVADLDPAAVSFTYGDSHPVLSERPNAMDGREYRGQVYTLAEIRAVIGRHGLPQEWNADGAHGPERYVEAHVWTDDVVGLARPVTDPQTPAVDEQRWDL